MNTTYKPTQLAILLLLRVLIGWHFFYEGLCKILSPAWSAKAYLLDSKGICSGFFHQIAAHPQWLTIVDALNQWGLLFIGAALILGLFSRFACLAAGILLSTYILSHPAGIDLTYALPSEGNYLWIDKNVIELGAIAVLYVFPTGQWIGLDRLRRRRKNEVKS
jgi:thiosulfate dehydrogenase [quinone] large subunit